MPGRSRSGRAGRGAGRSSRRARGTGRRWSQGVTTTSTHPGAGLFTKDARTIARRMGSRRVSPKGIGSGIRMIQFFMNRAGSKLAAPRRRVLERAKKILQERQRQDHRW
jgi:Protein of unknown function (DUF3175)